MLLQAAGFAVLAALSPTALLITAIYLGSARPRTTALCYLAGAVLISPRFPCLRAHPGQRGSILGVN